MKEANDILHYIVKYGLGLYLFSSSVISTELDKVDSWDVDGANGSLYVHGTLTESACRLAMSSAHQTVELGTLGTGQLLRAGKIGIPIAVQLRLEDCLSGESRNRNKLGNLLWSSDMPAMKIRFLALADSQNPELAAVTGAKGIALQLSNASHHPIAIGQYSTPELLSPGQHQLTYYITPIRTSVALNAGAYQAIIRFQLSYD